MKGDKNMRMCANCRAKTEAGEIVKINYKNVSYIRFLCFDCLQDLKKDKKIISYQIIK